MTTPTTNPPTEQPVTPIVKHCGDTYKACCLPWGWCSCICGDCRIAKYTEQEKRNESLGERGGKP